jgi:hypothetical protein
MQDFAKFNSNLQKSLEKIGRTNGSAPPESQDPLDKLLHYYFVDKTGEKFFKDQAAQSKSLAIAQGGEYVDQIIQGILRDTIKNNRGESSIIAAGQFYGLEYTTRKPAMRVNVDKIKTQLMIKHGFSQEDVAKLIEECSEASKPTEIFAVKPLR